LARAIAREKLKLEQAGQAETKRYHDLVDQEKLRKAQGSLAV
jgi:hypothetical protein